MNFSLKKLLDDNDFLHKRIQKHKDVITLYREALKIYARRFPEKANMNEAEMALEKGKALEKLL